MSNLSEEEIIDKINYMINNWHRSVLEIKVEWIQGLLDLYNKEKEKNKEHKKRITYLENKIFNQKQEMKENYINKDKIRELPRTEYCNAECLMNGIYVDWDYIKELLEE